MSDHVTIPAKYNGPPNSGNGGYSCGAVAAFIDGPARVRLHSPPPLDTSMALRSSGEGEVALFADATQVATGIAAPLELDVPPAPDMATAHAAREHYPCLHSHLLPTCYVCGTERPDGDGLELYTGPVDAQGTVACSWQPASDQLDDAGNVRAEIVWAALDCPGYIAAKGSDLRPALLGELHADLFADVPGGDPLVAYAWPLGEEGRKCYAGTAIATADGRVLAAARTTWIILKS